MGRAIFCVLEGRDGWMVRLNGKAFGPVPDQEAAVEAAVSAARWAHGRDLYAQVVLYKDRVFRSLWANGRDLAVQAV